MTEGNIDPDEIGENNYQEEMKYNQTQPETTILKERQFDPSEAEGEINFQTQEKDPTVKNPHLYKKVKTANLGGYDLGFYSSTMKVGVDSNDLEIDLQKNADSSQEKVTIKQNETFFKDNTESIILPTDLKKPSLKNETEVESLRRQLKEKEIKIQKLSHINTKLVADIKQLSSKLDTTLDRAKSSKRGTITSIFSPSNPELRDKEMCNAQKLIKIYQKEITTLKLKLDSVSGYDRAIELENELKQSESKNAELLREIKVLQQIQKNQGKEIHRISNTQEYETKIKLLSEQLKAMREKCRDQEHKITAENTSNFRYHSYVSGLKDRYMRLKEEVATSKKASIDPVPEEKPDNKVEILQASLKSEKKRYEKERLSAKKQIESLQEQLDEARQKIKETEQENRINTLKLKELHRMVRSNQIKALQSEEPAEESSAKPRNSKTPFIRKTKATRPTPYIHIKNNMKGAEMKTVDNSTTEH